MDYYGKRLATASSDRSVRIFDVVEGNYQLIATLPGCVDTYARALGVHRNLLPSPFSLLCGFALPKQTNALTHDIRCCVPMPAYFTIICLGSQSLVTRSAR